MAVVAIIPVVTIALAFTNEAHHLMWSSARLDATGPFLALAVTHGPWFSVHVAYTYLLNLFGAGLIFVAIVQAPGVYRYQGWVLLVGLLLPLTGNLLDFSARSWLRNLDLTSIM